MSFGVAGRVDEKYLHQFRYQLFTVIEAPSKEEVPITELVRSLTFQLESMIRLLERKGLLSREEVLREIRTMIVTHRGDGAKPSTPARVA